jgi:4-hydroxymandelate oxidase
LTSGRYDLARFEEEARAHLHPLRFAYVSGAAGDSAEANVAAWQQLRLRPRMLRDVGVISTVTTLLGQPCKTPIVVAPTAMHRLAWADGELATARGAAKAGAIYVVSAQATTAIEDIAGAAPAGPRWMQAYMMRDRGLTRAMLERAAAAGCSAVVLTVDSPGIPHSNPGSTRSLNEGLRLPNLLPGVDAPDVLAVASNYATDLTFDDLGEIRSWTGLPLVVKGVLRGDDARCCLDAGVDGVVVSNHGGRLVPGCIATATALAEVVEAVAGRRDVYVDGGIRSGADVLKALALGAAAVMVGRPVWWGLAAGGDSGVFAVLDGLRAELERTMALCGVTDVQRIPPDLLGGGPGRSFTA